MDSGEKEPKTFSELQAKQKHVMNPKTGFAKNVVEAESGEKNPEKK